MERISPEEAYLRQVENERFISDKVRKALIERIMGDMFEVDVLADEALEGEE